MRIVGTGRQALLLKLIDAHPSPCARALRLYSMSNAEASTVTVETGSQHVPTYATVGTPTCFNHSAKPDIVFEDLLQNNDKVRFYTGFVNFAMLSAVFQCLLSHGADKLNYWRGEQSVGERSYHEAG